MSCLIVKEDTCFQLNNFYLVVQLHLGKFADVNYYQVTIQEIETDPNLNFKKPGLLRIGDVNGGLSCELQLRHALKENSAVSELITFCIEEVELFSNIDKESDLEESFNYPNLDTKLIQKTDFVLENHLTKSNPANESDLNQTTNNENVAPNTESYFDGDWEETENYDYLEDDSAEITNVSPNSKLILLSYLPTAGQTLDIWLQKKHSYELALDVTNQVCQLFQQAYQQEWCFFQVIPQFIQVNSTIKFFDLTNVRLVSEKVGSVRETEYCAPEIAFDCPVSEGMSAYIIGVLLYQAIYQQLPNTKPNFSFSTIPPIPGIHQIINLCLFPIVNERISLTQLTEVLKETQQTVSSCKVQWDVASRSTMGLSMQRLHNEDSYGVQQYSSSYKDVILAVLADGMGGLAQGELASYLAVKTVIETPIDCFDYSEAECNEWLVAVVKKANKYVREKVIKGGTTLSVVWANSRHLRIAHVGDSRIYLIRKNMICQLSEDHSLVAILLAKGDITYAESYKHKKRNVLTKCIGLKDILDSSYVQTLQSFDSKLSILLEQDDIVILCSDGVWDLIPPTELAEIFTATINLRLAVNNTIDLVLTRGARDNATIVAMKCNLLNQY